MILVDTGFWLALANRSDRHHVRAKDAYAGVKEELVTTWPVLTETCHLLLRLGPEVPVRFMRSATEEAFSIFDLNKTHLERIEALLQKYADLPMDLADASLVVAAEDLGSGRIFSTDQRDFRSYKWKKRKPFQNLLL